MDGGRGSGDRAGPVGTPAKQRGAHAHDPHLDRFTCEEVFRRLDDFIDRELTPVEMRRAEEHLQTCEGCAKEYAFEASLIQSVRVKLRHIDVPESLLERVATALAREREGRNGSAKGGN
ncbi:MAG: anti-sigma factor [Gemmatimonadaceae bacterium]